MEFGDFNFHIDHIGINQENEESALKIAEEFASIFGFEYKVGNSSVFTADKRIEITKRQFLGTNGHIAVSTSDIDSAVKYIKSKGAEFFDETAVINEGKLIAIYLKKEIGGFAIHLVRK